MARPVLPSIEDVVALPATDKAVLRGELVTLLLAVLTDPMPTSNDMAADALLDVKAAAARLGLTVGYLRHNGDRLHNELLEATGTGFVVPWGDGTVRYSAHGLAALVDWRRTQPRTRAVHA
jgi:hypothetical protein